MKSFVYKFRLVLFATLASFLVSATTIRAAAPTVLSVSPAEGATQVPTTVAITFTFDQDMDTNIVLFPSGTGYTAMYEVTAPNFNQFLVATWTGLRTLEIKPVIQFPYATFTWKLNATGPLILGRIKGQNGLDLVAASGTFTTGVGGTDPRLGSSFPIDNSTGVQTNIQVLFRFDTVMKKISNFSGSPGPIIWTGAGLDASKFSYSWSADGKTLSASYSGGLPIDTLITWLLNPTGATVKFESETGGRFLATNFFTGKFTTASAETGCNEGGLPLGWASYALSKNYNYKQTSTADPIPNAEEESFLFSAYINMGAQAGAISNASVTRPGQVADPLQSIGSLAQFSILADTAAELETDAPPGNYVLRYTLTGQAERVIDMTMPATAQPTPKILNFDEAQSINPTAAFTLRWNAFPNPTELSHISIYISDDQGHIVFQAPNPCVPRLLFATDTSVVIPAGRLKASASYNASILFGQIFHFDTNSIPQVYGFGNVIKNTYFIVKTLGGQVVGAAAELVGWELLPNGNPQFTIKGTIGAAYSIERSSTLTTPNWTEVGTVTITATGQASFEDTGTGKSLPLFYRVLAK